MAMGPIRGSVATARPAMTMENSPRATSVPPARHRPRDPIPARRAAYHPVPILVKTVTTASSRAGSSTGGIWAGSVESPKNTKKTAANRSRSGVSSLRAPSATSPESAIPTRNAPTAAETCNCWATPATRTVSPRTTRSSISGLSEDTARLMSRPCRSARYSTNPTVPSATSRAMLPPARPTPASIAVSSGR